MQTRKAYCGCNGARSKDKAETRKPTLRETPILSSHYQWLQPIVLHCLRWQQDARPPASELLAMLPGGGFHQHKAAISSDSGSGLDQHRAAASSCKDLPPLAVAEGPAGKEESASEAGRDQHVAVTSESSEKPESGPQSRLKQCNVPECGAKQLKRGWHYCWRHTLDWVWQVGEAIAPREAKVVVPSEVPSPPQGATHVTPQPTQESIPPPPPKPPTWHVTP